MKVKKLIEQLQSYVDKQKMNGRDGSNDDVLVCDDGLKERLFKVRFAVGSTYDKETAPAKVEVRDVLYSPPCKDHLTAEECQALPSSYCAKCKNYVAGSKYKASASRFGINTISCNNPRTHKVVENVIEYVGTSCMDYDPVEPLIRKIPVQVVPPKYKTKNVMKLVVDLLNEEK